MTSIVVSNLKQMRSYGRRICQTAQWEAYGHIYMDVPRPSERDVSDEVLIHEEMDPNRPVMIFVLGIVSIMACQICGPVAFFLGHRRECVERGIEPDDRDGRMGDGDYWHRLSDTWARRRAPLFWHGLRDVCGLFHRIVWCDAHREGTTVFRVLETSGVRRVFPRASR